ncbi:MAG: flippase-like domain-containing protein [Bacteroidales bacterium]|nr:flippase-like domain-containing protein [Bacteroidales bacterium]
MKKKIINIIKIVAFILFGVIIFYLVYKDFNFSNLWNELKTLNYWFFIIAFIFAILSHISRSIRWQMLIDSKENKTGFFSTFLAVLNGYLVNLAVPRAGEISRCAIVSNYSKIPFSKVVGTMASERIIDVIVMLLLTVFVFFLQAPQMKQFLENNPGFYDNFHKFVNPITISIAFIALAIFCILLFFIAKGKFSKRKIFQKIANFINGFWQGLINLKNLQKPIRFILLSFAIWTCYFFEFYFCFLSFPGELSTLNILVAITTFITCSYGVLAPTPNGLGAYHFIIIQMLLVYGISESSASSFALIVHGMQTFFIIILGIFSLIFIPFLKKKTQLLENSISEEN